MDYKIKQITARLFYNLRGRIEGEISCQGTGVGNEKTTRQIVHWAGATSLGRVLTGWVAGRRHGMTNTQRLQGSDWEFISMILNPSAAGTCPGFPGNTNNQGADLCFWFLRIYGTCHHHGNNDALQTSAKVLMNEHLIFFALDFRLKLYTKTHIS